MRFFDFNSMDFENISDCLNKVIHLVAEAGTIMTCVVNMPFAEPEDPRWDEFEKRPHIHELTDVFCSIYDTEKLAKKTLAQIDGTPSA